MGVWVRFKSWARNKVHYLVWTVVRSRVYRKIRSFVSAILPAVAICGLGTAAGAGVAAATGFPAGYGALIGLGISAALMVVVKACIATYRRQSTFTAAIRRAFWFKQKKSGPSSSRRR